MHDSRCLIIEHISIPDGRASRAARWQRADEPGWSAGTRRVVWRHSCISARRSNASREMVTVRRASVGPMIGHRPTDPMVVVSRWWRRVSTRHCEMLRHINEMNVCQCLSCCQLNLLCWRSNCTEWTKLNDTTSHFLLLTLWRPLLPYGHSCRASCARRPG